MAAAAPTLSEKSCLVCDFKDGKHPANCPMNPAYGFSTVAKFPSFTCKCGVPSCWSQCPSCGANASPPPPPSQPPPPPPPPTNPLITAFKQSVTDYHKALPQRVLLVCGSRYWDDKTLLEKTLSDYIAAHSQYRWTIVQGGCRGADMLAHQFAKDRNIPVTTYHADWGYPVRRNEGPKRNKRMVNESQPHAAFAFRCSGSSFGTDNCLRFLGVYKRKPGSRLRDLFKVRADGTIEPV